MSDLVKRLRTWVHAVNAVPVGDLLDEAADEIERLSSRLRFCDAVIRSGDVAALADAEREAVEQAATVADAACEEAKRWVGVPRWANGGVDDSSWQHVADSNAARAATLRGLLERLGGTKPMPKEKRA